MLELNKLLYEIKHPLFPGQQLKRSLFSRMFASKKRDIMREFTRRLFVSDDAAAASASLMPTMLQAIENNYGGGFCSIAINESGEKDRFDITIEEADERYVFAAGKNKYIRTVINFHGQRFLTASSVRAARNEDGESVLTLDTLFLETPFQRQIKIVLSKHPKFIFSETPGEDFALGSLQNIIGDFSKTPVIGSILSHDIWRSPINGLFTKTINLKIKNYTKKE